MAAPNSFFAHSTCAPAKEKPRFQRRHYHEDSILVPSVAFWRFFEAIVILFVKAMMMLTMATIITMRQSCAVFLQPLCPEAACSHACDVSELALLCHVCNYRFVATWCNKSWSYVIFCAKAVHVYYKQWAVRDSGASRQSVRGSLFLSEGYDCDIFFYLWWPTASTLTELQHYAATRACWRSISSLLWCAATMS